jgi:prepilin-type N-terminal cleavage/methylation domain-containing protein
MNYSLMKMIFQFRTNNNYVGFSLVELLVVIAIIGVLAATAIVTYSNYQASAKKAVAVQNFSLAKRLMASEIVKCQINPSGSAFGVNCPIQLTARWQEDIAVYLSAVGKIFNVLKPLDQASCISRNNSWNTKWGYLGVNLTTSDCFRGGLRSGDGEEDGDISLVRCPRSPYCPSSDTSAQGKFKLMLWWDGKQMIDYALLGVEEI